MVAAVVLLSGCSGGSPRAGVPARTDPTSSGRPNATLPRGAPHASAVRDCASSGQHGVTRRSLQQVLVIGPISLGGLGAELTRSGVPQRPSAGGRFPVLESIAVLAIQYWYANGSRAFTNATRGALRVLFRSAGSWARPLPRAV